MKTILATLLLSFSLLIFACSKDKFETKPRIEIKDYNTKELQKGQQLVIRLNYFDKEGDLNGSLFGVMKVRLNNFPPVAPQNYLEDTVDYQLPDFPPKDNGEISFTVEWDRLDESKTQNDTVQYRFAVTDKAGNASDTITSAVIVALQP